MTGKKDDDGGSTMDAEIDRTMAEAEAAVRALEHEHDTADDEDAPPAAAEPSRDAVEDALAERITELEEELAQTKDRWLRAVADLENYKKRTKRETDETVLRKTQQLLTSFLPTVDNLERALEISQPALAEVKGPAAQTIDQLVKGLLIVRDEFISALRKHGIEPLETVGQPFDPAVHDALQQMDSPDHAPGVVIREFERGYKL